MNTTPENLEITATTPAGNSYRVAVYVDPFPGRKGSEVLKDVCGRCNGDKVIHWGNVTLQVNGVGGRVCFQCMGKGYTTRLVSSARQTARRQAKAQTARNAAAADFAAGFDAQAALNREADHAEALLEQARRAALVQGFVAEEGVRVRGLKVTVEVNYQFETTDFHGRPDLKNLLILKAEDGKILKAVVPYSTLERGQEATVTGTVKAHASYNGQDQTVLQRVIIK